MHNTPGVIYQKNMTMLNDQHEAHLFLVLLLLF